jgi:hypothetical protein
MDKRAEHLSTLGLAPDASWDEVNQAYKDLMRVWHPDRFQSDERLRKKAEEQAQRINNAMGELRKLGKAGFGKVVSSKRAATHQARPTPKQSPQRPSHQNSANNASSRPSSDYSQASFNSYAIAPLHVRPKLSSTLLRVCAALGVFYLAYDSLLRPTSNPQQEAFTVALIFAALDFGTRNLFMLLVPKPIITVDRTGLFLLKTGRLNWIDIESVWPVITPRFSHLSVKFSSSYLAKQNLLTRLFFRLRGWGNPAHIIVPFNGLASDPVQVVNAMKLFQVNNQIAIVDIKPTGAYAVFVLQLLAATCCAIPVFRCLFEGGLHRFEYFVYVLLFLIFRTVEYGYRVARSRPVTG